MSPAKWPLGISPIQDGGFMSCYQAGNQGKASPTKAGGLPINADERQAYEAGRTDAKEEENEAAPAEEAEEEITPRSIPFEAVKYANAIKNKLKKNYAWAYLKWKTGKTEEKPESQGLSPWPRRSFGFLLTRFSESLISLNP